MSHKVSIIGTRGYPSFYGGFETLVRNLAPYLADEGWSVSVYGRPGATVPDMPTADERIDSRSGFGIETRSLSALSYGLTSCFDAARRRPDVALVMNVANGFWLPRLRAANVPTVVNVDGLEWEREKWGLLARGTFRIGAAFTARYADHIVCDSTEIGSYWRSVFGRENTFIPYGATAPGSLPPPPEVGGRPYVLMVARFVPENTVVEFFAAARRLATEWDVVIVGSEGYGGTLDAEARSLSTANPRVHWMGHISDEQRLFALWQHAAVYFHGHSVGGTNPALVQAMACGSAVVARDTVFNREVLGDAALFCRPEPGSIVTELTTVLTNRETRLVLQKRALERARLSFTWNAVCSSYEQLLTRAALGGAPH